MSDKGIRECGTFGVRLDRNSPLTEIEILNVASIVNPWLASIDPRWMCGVSFYLESLRLTNYLPSFPAAGFPETYASDTTAVKTMKLMELEAQFPKCGLQILRGKETQSGWLGLATVVLQNRGRESQIPLTVPYLTINEIKILSRNDRLAVKLVNFGDGVLGRGSIEGNRQFDYWQLEGEWRMDLDLAYYAGRPTGVNQVKRVVNTTTSQIMSNNPFRGYFEVQNLSTNSIFYGFTETAATSAPFELKPGRLYHPGNPEGFVPSEGFWAKTLSGTAEVSVVEWSYI